jgi:hypothetical protein
MPKSKEIHTCPRCSLLAFNKTSIKKHEKQHRKEDMKKIMNTQRSNEKRLLTRLYSDGVESSSKQVRTEDVECSVGVEEVQSKNNKDSSQDDTDIYVADAEMDKLNSVVEE